MILKFISYLPAIIGLLTIGLFVLLNNPRNTRNRVFAFLNLSVALWLFSLFVADITNSNITALIAIRLALFFGAITFLGFYLFALVFPYSSAVNMNRQKLYVLPLLLVAFLSLTPLVVPAVKIEEFGAQPVDIGALYTLSDLIGIAYLVAGAIILILKYRKSGFREKNQIRLILLGLSVAVIVNIITGLVLTVLNVDTEAILFGSFSLFIFSLFVAYAILRHGFFDIRSVVARSAAYVLSLGTLGTLGFLLVLGLSRFADRHEFSNSTQQIINVLFIFGLALSYQPLKHFFDKTTNRIFYRDAYDSQELLNELNRSLITTINLEDILTKTGKIIGGTLKVSHISFAIRDIETQSLRLIGRPDSSGEHSSIQAIVESVAHMTKMKIIVPDGTEEPNRRLNELMRKENLSVIVKLEGKIGGKTQYPGYIFLGQKRSGALYSPQDIQLLEIIADELVIAIQNALSFEEIQKFNITLQQKVDEATKQLRHANTRLKELDATKDEFISMASHQLRTPLTTIKGYLSMILEGDVGAVKKEQEPLLKQAFDSSQNMVDLIADLLNVSRLQSGKFVIDNKPTQLTEMVDAEVKRLSEQATAKNIKLEFKKASDIPLLNLDATKIRQVVMNFLDNAIYYTPNGGSITVELLATKDSVAYTVSDTGVGVPREVQRHLFTKFYRADNARKMRPDGTGLGLFMAKKVIAAQGGAIIFRSTEGKGSTFGFSFPRAKVELKGDVPKPAVSEKPA